MKIAIVLLPLIAVLFLGVIVIGAIDDHIKSQPVCTQSHTEIQHKGAYTTFIYNGKAMIPITHPARDVEVTICDEYTPRN